MKLFLNTLIFAQNDISGWFLFVIRRWCLHQTNKTLKTLFAICIFLHITTIIIFSRSGEKENARKLCQIISELTQNVQRMIISFRVNKGNKSRTLSRENQNQSWKKEFALILSRLPLNLYSSALLLLYRKWNTFPSSQHSKLYNPVSCWTRKFCCFCICKCFDAPLWIWWKRKETRIERPDKKLFM